MSPLPAIRARSADGERGSSVVETLLALGLVALVFVIGVQLVIFEQTRVIAIAAAQAGAQGATQDGDAAGLAAAGQVISAGGGLGRELHALIAQQPGSLTVTVAGHARGLFAAGILLPTVVVDATAPQEVYPSLEAKP